MNASHSKSSLFLMEIIIAILFFSLASAVCLRLFVTAHKMSEKDKDLNNAILWSQNLSESFYGCNGKLLMIKNLYPEAFLSNEEIESDGTLILFFDEDWNLVDSSLSKASYEAILNIKKASANDVYSDVEDIKGPLKGNAITGDITIIDIKDRSEGYMEVPEDEEYILFTNSVDVYVGKE